MSRVRLFLMAVGACLIILSGGTAVAQEATPVSADATPQAVADAGAPMQLTLVERTTTVTTIDLDPPGPSQGDLVTWGPDPLYDETNTTDTGAATYGYSLTINPAGDRMAVMTFIFADGSTIEVQGLEHGLATPSVKTITGGSGQYRGATGTLTDMPSADGLTWTKTFAIWL